MGNGSQKRQAEARLWRSQNEGSGNHRQFRQSVTQIPIVEGFFPSLDKNLSTGEAPWPAQRQLPGIPFRDPHPNSPLPRRGQRVKEEEKPESSGERPKLPPPHRLRPPHPPWQLLPAATLPPAVGPGSARLQGLQSWSARVRRRSLAPRAFLAPASSVKTEPTGGGGGGGRGSCNRCR